MMETMEATAFKARRKDWPKAGLLSGSLHRKDSPQWEGVDAVS